MRPRDQNSASVIASGHLSRRGELPQQNPTREHRHRLRTQPPRRVDATGVLPIAQVGVHEAGLPSCS